MKISIILPIFNVAAELSRCLDSIAAQTYHGDIECIAIDDASQDQSVEIFKRFINFYDGNISFRILHHAQNRGLSAARNTGIKASCAEYLFFMDSDDMIMPNCIERFVTEAEQREKEHIDMFVGNYLFDGPSIDCPRLGLNGGLLGHNNYIRAYCKEQIYPMAWNKLINRNFILKNGLFFEEGLIHEDTLWSFHILQHIQKAVIMEDCTYIYRIRPNSIQQSNDYIRHFKANKYIIEKLIDETYQSKLKYNPYIYDFIEAEKLRHIRDCKRAGHKQLAWDLYLLYRKKTHFQPWQALFLFGINGRIRGNIVQRDFHYSKSVEEGFELLFHLA